MRSIILVAAALVAAGAQAQSNCSRSELQVAVDSYFEAQTADFHRSIPDETTCQTFTELVVLDEDHPYAIGTRLRLVAGPATGEPIPAGSPDDSCEVGLPGYRLCV